MTLSFPHQAQSIVFTTCMESFNYRNNHHGVTPQEIGVIAQVAARELGGKTVSEHQLYEVAHTYVRVIGQDTTSFRRHQLTGSPFVSAIVEALQACANSE